MCSKSGRRWRHARSEPIISLFADEERNVKRERLGDLLQVLDQAIDFVALARAVEAKREVGGSGRGGCPPYPTELDDPAAGGAADVQPVRRRAGVPGAGPGQHSAFRGA